MSVIFHELYSIFKNVESFSSICFQFYFFFHCVELLRTQTDRTLFFILAAQIDSDFPIGLNAAKRMRWQTRKIAFLMISNYQIFRKMNKNRITKQNWATSELNKNNTVLSIKSPKKNMNASILRAAKCNNGKKLFTKTLQTCKFITVRLLCFGGF